MDLQWNSVAVVFVAEEWAKCVNAEGLFGTAKEMALPNTRAFAVKLLGSDDFGLFVQALYGDQPTGNELRVIIPWRSLMTIAWRPDMEREQRNKIGF